MAATTYALDPNVLDQASDLEAISSPSEVLDPDISDTGEAYRSDESAASEPANSSVDWPDLVHRIQQGVESGMEDLYRVFARGHGATAGSLFTGVPYRFAGRQAW